MADITVPDVPPEVVDVLVARAARAGRALEDYLRDELIAWTSDADALVRRAREQAALAESEVSSDEIVAAIHEARDERLRWLDDVGGATD